MIDDELEKVYRTTLRLRLDQCMALISEAKVTMRQVEVALGLSEGYLSKVKQGRSEPSPILISGLCLVAEDAKARMATLETLWGENPAAVLSAVKKGSSTIGKPKGK